MNKKEPLAPFLLQHLALPQREQLMTITDLEQKLRERVNTAQHAYPTIHLPLEQFLALIAEKLNRSPDCINKFLSWRLDELYLVTGCLAGIPEAFVAFEKQIFSLLESQLLSILKSPSRVSDLKQNLIQDLFVAQEGTEPKIHQYLPIKDLRNWVAIVAVRRAIDLSKKTKKEFALLEKDLSRAPEFKSDPELEYLKSLYQHEFAVAFKQALGLLTCQERNLLRYHVLDGLNIDQLGIIYKAHRATVARWLAKIRQKLLNKTRLIIMQTLKASPAEYESIMRLIQSQLHASIEEHLNREPEK